MDFSVTVSIDEFESACKYVKKTIKGKKPFDLKLNFIGSALRIEALTASYEIPITGTATATIILPGQLFRKLQGTFPKSVALQLSLTGTTFKIATLSLPCRVAA